jgi:hypothetical protein
MKSFKNILRLWISFTSVFGFFGAWAMLAQSFKPPLGQPIPATAYPTLTELAPISIINSAVQSNANLQVVIPPTPIPYPTPQPQIFFAPRVLRTSGS